MLSVLAMNHFFPEEQLTYEESVMRCMKLANEHGTEEVFGHRRCLGDA